MLAYALPVVVILFPNLNSWTEPSKLHLGPDADAVPVVSTHHPLRPGGLALALTYSSRFGDLTGEALRAY